MPPVRRKRPLKKEAISLPQTAYDAAIQQLKETLKITPKSAKHLYGMGYTTPEALKSPKIKPEQLEIEMQEYLERTNQTFQSAPKRSGAMYRVAFRRILWTARASEEEKKLFPERMTCNYWSNKAIASREASSGTIHLTAGKTEESAGAHV